MATVKCGCCGHVEELVHVCSSCKMLNKVKLDKPASKVVEVKPAEQVVSKTVEKKKVSSSKCVCDSFVDETRDYSLKEWINFDYKDFLGMVLMTVNDDDFSNLKALNSEELSAGYLTDAQVEALRQVMHTGFERNWNLKLIAQEIKDKVKPGDVFRMDNAGNIVMGSDGKPVLATSADRRALMIARTETVRLGNLGAVNYYEKEGAELVEWVATVFSDRTCDYCMSMNGKTFTPDEIRKMASNNEFPAHPGCRCALMQFT